MGKALELSGDGRIRISQGLVIGEQWVVQEAKKKKGRYVVQILDPATGKRVRVVQLEVDESKGNLLIETDLTTGEKWKMAFVSRGQQDPDPPFLGRWQFMLQRFGVLAVYEYTQDGWLWLRAPIQAETGTYRQEADKIIPQWPGEYQSVLEILVDDRFLTTTSPDGSKERFLRPKLLETLSPRPTDPRN